jgi:hypothetical protein
MEEAVKIEDVKTWEHLEMMINEGVVPQELKEAQERAQAVQWLEGDGFGKVYVPARTVADPYGRFEYVPGREGEEYMAIWARSVNTRRQMIQVLYDMDTVHEDPAGLCPLCHGNPDYLD